MFRQVSPQPFHSGLWPAPARSVRHACAHPKGKLRGKQPKLSARQQRELAQMAGTGEYTIARLAEVFTVSGATVFRTLQRSQRNQAR